MGLVCSIHSQDKQITNIDHHYHRLLPACITGTVFDLICSIGFSCLWWMCVDHCIGKRIAIFVVNSGTVYEWSYIVFEKWRIRHGTILYNVMICIDISIYWILNHCICNKTFGTKLYLLFSISTKINLFTLVWRCCWEIHKVEENSIIVWSAKVLMVTQIMIGSRLYSVYGLWIPHNQLQEWGWTLKNKCRIYPITLLWYFLHCNLVFHTKSLRILG